MSNILIIILMSMIVITTTDAEVVNRTENNEWDLKSPIIIAYFKFNSKTTSKIETIGETECKSCPKTTKT